MTDTDVSVRCTARLLYARKKYSAASSRLFAKLRERINLKCGSIRLRNIVKELQFLWKRKRKNRMAVVGKHDERRMAIVALHAGIHRDFIPNSVFTFSYDYCNQTMNVLNCL